MLTGLILATFTAIGGGTDSVSPTYVDDVNFSRSVFAREDVDQDVVERVDLYADMYDMSWSQAYRWYLGEDNRAYGLADVSEAFSSIFEGYSVRDGDVIVWVSTLAKSGGIVDLLDDYDVDVEIRTIPDDVNLDSAAYTFVTNFGSRDYYAAEPNDTETGLVIYTSSEDAADAGPVLHGTAIEGVPVEYRYSE